MRTPAILLFTLFGLTLPSLAQTARTAPVSPPPATPLPGSRILRTFDFEETKLGNYESIPMYWSKVVGKGFTAYSNGAFDKTVARSPGTSFKLETSGGSVAYRLTPPPEKRILIQPDADYYVLAFVRTSQLKHARAELTAWFADEKGSLIPETELHSQIYTPNAPAENDADAWRVLYISIPGPTSTAPPGAATPRSLVLQLGLMQPQQLGGAGTESPTGLGKFEIYQQDIKGAAWFDDVVVFQLPRVAVSIPHEVAAAGGIFGPLQNIDLDVIVSDMAGTTTPSDDSPAAVAPPDKSRPLDARLRITDPEGLLFASEHWTAAATQEQSWTHRYTHPPLPPGLYTATLEVADAKLAATGTSGGDVVIARRQTQFLCLPANAPATPAAIRAMQMAPEFGLGLSAHRMQSTAEELALWPHLVTDTGAGLIQLPIWRREMTDETLSRRDPAFDALLNTLQRSGVRTIGAFSELPSALTQRLPSVLPADISENPSLLALLHAEPAIWKPYFSLALARYANRMDLWELGDPASPFSGELQEAGAGHGTAPSDLTDRYAQLYARTAGEIDALLNRPQLIIPWNALFDFDPRPFPRAALDLRLPSVIKPAQLPAYIENFRQSAATPATAPGAPATSAPPPATIYAHIEALDPRTTSHADRLTDFAQRLVYARTANPQAIVYDLAGRDPLTHRLSPAAPDELLLVYRTLIMALGNATYAGELPVAPGVRAFLFNRNVGGTLVLWSDSASADIDLDLPLGPTPRLTEILGTPHVLPVNPATHLTHVQLHSGGAIGGGAVTILDQLDPRPLQLKTSFALATANIPAGAGSLHTEVLLKNPYNETLAGVLRLQLPKSWNSDPSTFRVLLAPGASLRQPIMLRYPFTENAGPKEITATLSLEPGAAILAQEMPLTFPCAVSSDTVEMEAFAQILDTGDIVIQQMITNISSDTLNAQAYALLPNYPRQQRYVLALAPGQTAIKRFSFPAAAFVRNTGSATAPAAVLPPSAADIVAALTGKTATLGLQADGKTLLTKTVPLE